MYSGYSGSINDLDYIRRSRGKDVCRDTFRRFVLGQKQTAVRLINDDRLFFASLFVLQQEIQEFGLYRELSEHNRIALDICRKISEAKNPSAESSAPLSLKDEMVHTVLLWMFYTGAADDGLSNEFDHILDISASILIKTHHENTVLNTVADLIFKRNRRGSYTHDLIWAFFQAHDPQSLRIIAEYLRSPRRKDVELARTLLHLPQAAGPNGNSANQYRDYLSWLEENSPYLYFTGESFQLTNSPNSCDVNLEAKYLCKNSSLKRREILDSFNEEDRDNLNNFSGVQEEEKTVLADYSNKLHHQNPLDWNQWMKYPIEQQIQVAKYGRRDFI